MFIKRLQLGLIHVAVAMTLVPINSALNRVMIFELGIAKTLVAVLAALPYLLSPAQVVIGSFADRRPIFGFRRSPYILAGLLLCAAGLAVSPYAAYLIEENYAAGLLIGLLGFGAWGIGYNLSAVSYLALASELSGEKERGKTVATMFFMMVLGLIATGIGLSKMLAVYSPEALARAFATVAGIALLLGLTGLIRLEPRAARTNSKRNDSPSLKESAREVFSNPVARVFFLYLLLLLAALLGQDVLLEPFGAEAFGMTVEETSRIVSISGAFTLLAFLLAGWAEGKLSKRLVAQTGNLTALAGFLVILLSGWTGSLTLFYLGLTLLGFGTGLSTVANLSLMFDLTTPQKMGLYIGAWGFSNGLSRLTGLLLSGVVADFVSRLSGSELSGYLTVFGLEALMIAAAVLLFPLIDAGKFRQQAEEPSFLEKTAIIAD